MININYNCVRWNIKFVVEDSFSFFSFNYLSTFVLPSMTHFVFKLKRMNGSFDKIMIEIFRQPPGAKYFLIMFHTVRVVWLFCSVAGKRYRLYLSIDRVHCFVCMCVILHNSTHDRSNMDHSVIYIIFDRRMSGTLQWICAMRMLRISGEKISSMQRLVCLCAMDQYQKWNIPTAISIHLYMNRIDGKIYVLGLVTRFLSLSLSPLSNAMPEIVWTWASVLRECESVAQT